MTKYAPSPSPPPYKVRDFVYCKQDLFFSEFPKVFSKGDFPIHPDDGLVAQIIQYIDRNSIMCLLMLKNEKFRIPPYKKSPLYSNSKHDFFF